MKVNLNLHFCEGSKRFHCIVSRDSQRKEIDFDSVNSPIHIKYAYATRVPKFYAFLNFEKPCILNVTARIDLLPEKFLPSKNIGDEDLSFNKREQNTLISKYYHTNLINELEKMEILPYGGGSTIDSSV